MRERGLKAKLILRNMTLWDMSLPMRERGLKETWDKSTSAYKQVAPYAGAWIESERHLRGVEEMEGSLPMRERGLKAVNP